MEQVLKPQPASDRSTQRRRKHEDQPTRVAYLDRDNYQEYKGSMGIVVTHHLRLGRRYIIT